MSEQKQENKEEGSRRRPRPYPIHSLQQALVVAQAIQDKNAGKPMRRIFVAQAIGRKPGSSEFKLLLSSSFKYDLTVGTEKAEYIALTPVGQAVTKPKNPEEKTSALRKAALSPELFKKIYEHYKSAKLPQEDFLRNVLEREFGVPREWVDDCVKILLENGGFASIIRDISGSPYVVLEELAPFPSEIPTERAELPQKPAELERPPELPPKPAEPAIKQIFVAHGKNRVPLDQLKKILDQFGIPYKIAIEEPYKGRPISAKVAELMRECTSAIFVFTTDEEYLDAKGNKAYRPSDNVVYELGAATVLYGNKIVIFKEESVDFASDFKDFGYIAFEKDKLDAKAMELLKELVALGFLKVVPA